MIKLIVQVLSGGALGAIITLLVTNFRNKIQAIGYKISVDPIFFPNSLTDKTITKITFSGEDKVYDFENLFSATISLQNIGNKDLSEILVGVSVAEKISILRADILSSDRHHTGLLKNQLSYDNLKSEVDIEFKPFNRKDIYEVKLLLTINKKEIEFDDIKFSSPSPIIFKPESTLTIGKVGLEIMSKFMYIP